MTRRRLAITFLSLTVCEIAIAVLTPLAMVSRDANRLAGHREQR